MISCRIRIVEELASAVGIWAESKPNSDVTVENTTPPSARRWKRS